MALAKLKKGLNHLDGVAGRAGADTIRLWESYREQALLWRAIALLQVPATILSLVAAIAMFFFADTVINVPPMPAPGYYSARNLPDSAFRNVAEEVVNLIGTFQPSIARRQFMTARKYMWEPALSAFEKTMIHKELPIIRSTSRSQLFWVNHSQIKVRRYPDSETVTVAIPGTKRKLLGTKTVEDDQYVYFVTMSTIPRHSQNDYGIVVVDLKLHSMRDLKPANQKLSEKSQVPEHIRKALGQSIN